MSDLYPTPSRLALLRDVDADHCYRWSGLGGDGVIPWGDANAKTGQAVTACMVEVERAGWVHLGPAGAGGYRRWRLTEAGRAVLNVDEHEIRICGNCGTELGQFERGSWCVDCGGRAR